MELAAFFQGMRCRLRPHENTHILLMVKLTGILLLACCLQLSAKSYGQTITLSKTNAPLQEVFLDIYRQTGYYFMCKDNLLESAHKVDIQVKDATLLEVSLEEYLAYTTEETEKMKVQEYSARFRSIEKGIKALALDIKNQK